ncbi:MAG: hypothetical protein HOF49_03185 [Nitrosomonadales bacterium]|jgi:outer membrane biogenesis lipoprotein LolB|nr:hypothetical protein [Nitrosomonadales bacterium]MBT4183034.1 hypothetical protein [Nitrosomonadales bacterium]MBT6014975.1 hypothetical protein [Nitrosomonadales bacterium]MBT7121006.1 hypothetical protein [Nitrosomonadales bacterium]
MHQFILNVIFLFLLTGCASKGYSIDEIFEDGAEIDSTPEDSIKYTCNQNKYFYIQYIGDEKKSLWIIFPKNEIKLYQTEISNVFSNGITKLIFNEQTTTVKKDGSIFYNECSKQT